VGKNLKTNNLAVKKDGGEIDAITAATISSRAFSNAVTNAWKGYQLALENKFDTEKETLSTEKEDHHE
jgi:electron transport complex protein RnfG